MTCNAGLLNKFWQILKINCRWPKDVFDMVADMIRNKKLESIITKSFICE